MCVTPIIEEGMHSPRRGGGVSVYEAAGHGGYMMNGGSFSPRSLSPLHQQQLMQQQLPPPSPTAHPDAGGPYNPQTIRQVISSSDKLFLNVFPIQMIFKLVCTQIAVRLFQVVWLQD